ncbi:hypothetical protein BCR44DRAFT_1179078 [Catenaria anguillulae PL171]|uniref:Uncharacterized protein n=1 Tax=Catenaria anguillulae PL171 TaxID=765915 RepID=A0A1Y2HIB4_9FUNG|nr:hypothetical protein BCR44DRAFT_1179078 [Catenaria anguillulae PL171]
MAYLSRFLLSAVYKRVHKYKAPDHEAFRLMVLSMSLAGKMSLLKPGIGLCKDSEISVLTEGGLMRFVIAYLIWLDSALTKVLEASGGDKKLEYPCPEAPSCLPSSQLQEPTLERSQGCRPIPTARAMHSSGSGSTAPTCKLLQLSRVELKA